MPVSATTHTLLSAAPMRLLLTALCCLALTRPHASPASPNCAHTFAGTDFSGHDLSPPCGATAESAAACCAQCGARSGCRAWTFISPRQCCLKTSDAGRRAVPGHVSGCIGNCSGPPAPPHPAPPPPPPPPPPPVQWGTPLLPGWPATYNMSLSTMIEPCDYDRMFDTRFAARFGMVDFDWSNAKNVWANTRPMSCEETLIEAAERTHALNPQAKVLIYRNLVKALPWFRTVREKLDDPAYSGFFLKFNTSTPHVPRCDNHTGKCSVYYHDQLQTPTENGTVDRDSLNAGNCSAGGCDCGSQPCGEYLFDHRNGSMLRDFLVNEFIGGPTGVDNPAVSGVNIDDYWNWRGNPGGSGEPDGPSEEDSHAVADAGLSDADVAAMNKGWFETMTAVRDKLRAVGKFQAEWANCPYTPNNTRYCWGDATERNANSGVAGQKAGCTAYMRQHCRPRNRFHSLAYTTDCFLLGLVYSFVFTKVASGQPLTADGKLPAFEQDLARFLLLRGPYAWIGYSWQMCGDAYVRPPALDLDYGEPVGDCAEIGESEVFARRWSKANVSLDCRSFTASIDML